MTWSDLTMLEEVRDRVDDAGPSSDVWYYVRVEVAAQSLERGNLLDGLAPDLSLRATGGERYVIEGHADLDDLPVALREAKSALASVEGGSGRVLSVTVEPHDYELIDAPVLYLGT